MATAAAKQTTRGSIRVEGNVKLVPSNVFETSQILQKALATAGQHFKQAFGRDASSADFLPFEFILCHAGKNANGDIMTVAEWKKVVNAGLIDGKPIELASYLTPVGEPLDQDHDTAFAAIVGDILSSEIVEPSGDEPAYIKCSGVVYRTLYPTVAFKVIRGTDQGYCKISMECEFESSEGIQSVGGRILRGINFRGAAFTRFPADEEDPRILSVNASKKLKAEAAIPTQPNSSTVGDAMSKKVVFAEKEVGVAEASVEFRTKEIATAEINLEDVKKAIELTDEEKKVMIEVKQEQIARLKTWLQEDLSYLAECLEDLAKLEGGGDMSTAAEKIQALKVKAAQAKAKVIEMALAAKGTEKEAVLASFKKEFARAEIMAKADANEAIQMMEEALAKMKAEVGGGAPAAPGAEKPAAPAGGAPAAPGAEKPAGAPAAPAAPAAPHPAPAAPPAAAPHPVPPAPGAGAPPPSAAPAAPAAPPAGAPAPSVAPAAPGNSDAQIAQSAMDMHSALHGENVDATKVAAAVRAMLSYAATAHASKEEVEIAAVKTITEEAAGSKTEADAKAAKMQAEADEAAVKAAEDELTAANAAKAAAEAAAAGATQAAAPSKANPGLSIKNGKVSVANIKLAREFENEQAKASKEAGKVAQKDVPASFTLSSKKGGATASDESATEPVKGKYEKGALAKANFFKR